MSKLTDAAVYSTITTIVTAVALIVFRSLLGIPIDATELAIIIIAVWPINFTTQIILKRKTQ